MTRPRPLVIGHRGSPGYRPEHTRSSYELAIAHGADAVEPDVVFSRDGVAVVRHENEIGSTTDVADRPEFAGRRTTKIVDGVAQTGWFTEDFTWEELSTLRCRERLPQLRPESATHDGEEPMLRLRDVLDLAARGVAGRDVGVVLEIKHATVFAELGFDVAALLSAELRSAGWGSGERTLFIESFEPTILTQLRAEGVEASFVFLLEAEGSPFDLVRAEGAKAPTYRQLASTGLASLAERVDGISVDKLMLLAPESRDGRDLVRAAHDLGLLVFTWTCRPENAFLDPRHRIGDEAARFGDYEAEWRELAATGVDGVFVDHVDLGRRLFG